MTMNFEDENASFALLPLQVLPAKLNHQEKLLCPRIPAPQLPKFDGRGSATEWWMSFVAFITLTNIPAVKAIQMLHLYFSGIALQWFTVLDPVKKSSSDTFKQAFFARFKPSSLINTDLLSIQQQPGESVKEYFHRVQKLSSDSTMDDSDVTELAKKGLHHQLGVFWYLSNQQRWTFWGEKPSWQRMQWILSDQHPTLVQICKQNLTQMPHLYTQP